MGIELALGSPVFRSMTSGALRDVTTCPDVLQEASRRAQARAPGDCGAPEAQGLRVGLHGPVHA